MTFIYIIYEALPTRHLSLEPQFFSDLISLYRSQKLSKTVRLPKFLFDQQSLQCLCSCLQIPSFSSLPLVCLLSFILPSEGKKLAYYCSKSQCSSYKYRNLYKEETFYFFEICDLISIRLTT